MSEFANYEAWATAAQAIAVAMTAQGLNAALEYQFIGITLADGRTIAFGDLNDTWMGDVYQDQESFGDPIGHFDTGLSTDTFDPATVATAAAEAIAKLPPPPVSRARKQFAQRLQQFTDAAHELTVAWEALRDGTSAGYPFPKSFDEVLIDIIGWNNAVQKETK